MMEKLWWILLNVPELDWVEKLESVEAHVGVANNNSESVSRRICCIKPIPDPLCGQLGEEWIHQVLIISLVSCIWSNSEKGNICIPDLLLTVPTWVQRSDFDKGILHVTRTMNILLCFHILYYGNTLPSWSHMLHHLIATGKVEARALIRFM